MRSLARALPALLTAALALFSVSTAQPARDAVWLIPIETEITPATTQFVRSRIELANEEQPLALLFLIDTPGGQVSAMERIVDAIMLEAQVPTLAVVRNAFSAGALIAMSAEQLAMLPGSSIGAALPVGLGPGGVTPVDEKLSSAVRGTFRSVAEARGRDARVAEAMVDPRIEIPGLSTSEELVTLTAQQAVQYGIADTTAATVADALDQFGYGGARVVRLEPNLTERIGTFLANPIAAAILLVVGLGGIVIELFSPGFGVPGGIGLVALALLAASAVIATPAGAVDLLLILGGVLLLAVELLVLPGFGVAGILGLASIVFAVFRIFQEQSLSVLGWTALFGAVMTGLAIWLLPNTRLASGLTLRTRLLTDRPDPATGAAAGPFDHLVGRRGTAASDLRPAGIARIGDERLDVVTQGNFIPVGTPIEVYRVEGNRIIVREAENQ